MMVATDERVVDALVAGGQSNTAFWVLLACVGLIALLFSLKLVLRERGRGRLRHDHTE